MEYCHSIGSGHSEAADKGSQKKQKEEKVITWDSKRPTILSQQTHFIIWFPQHPSLPCIEWDHVIKSWTRTYKQKSRASFQNTSLKITSVYSSPHLGSLPYPVPRRWLEF